jgi:chromosome condensin MukBEF MukE localization factor
MKEAASRLGARIRREDGCREAVRLIEDAGAMEWQARR